MNLFASLSETLSKNKDLKFALKGAAVALFAVALLSLATPNRFTSSAQILSLVKANKDPMGGLQALQQATGGALGSNQENAIPEIIKSRTILEPVLNKEYVFHYSSWRFGRLKETRQTLVQFLSAPNFDQALSKLRDAVDSDRNPKTGICAVKVTLASADLACQVNEGMLQGLDEYLRETRQKRGRDQAEYMADQVKAAQKALDEAVASYLGYAELNKGYALSMDPRVRVEGQRREFTVEMKKQIYARLANQVETAVLEAKDDTPMTILLDKPSCPQEKAGPHRLMLALSAAIAGFCISLLWSCRDRLKVSEGGR